MTVNELLLFLSINVEIYKRILNMHRYTYVNKHTHTSTT